MTIQIELDMLHFMIVYQLLMETQKEIKMRSRSHISFDILKEAFQTIDEQFSEQYTDKHGEYFERRHLIRKTLGKN